MRARGQRVQCSDSSGEEWLGTFSDFEDASDADDIAACPLTQSRPCRKNSYRRPTRGDSESENSDDTDSSNSCHEAYVSDKSSEPNNDDVESVEVEADTWRVDDVVEEFDLAKIDLDFEAWSQTEKSYEPR